MTSDYRAPRAVSRRSSRAPRIHVRTHRTKCANTCRKPEIQTDLSISATCAFHSPTQIHVLDLTTLDSTTAIKLATSCPVEGAWAECWRRCPQSARTTWQCRNMRAAAKPDACAFLIRGRVHIPMSSSTRLQEEKQAQMLPPVPFARPSWPQSARRNCGLRPPVPHHTVVLHTSPSHKYPSPLVCTIPLIFNLAVWRCWCCKKPGYAG